MSSGNGFRKSLLPFPLLDGKYIVRFAPGWCFLLRDHWLNFDNRFGEKPINQSIKTRLLFKVKSECT